MALDKKIIIVIIITLIALGYLTIYTFVPSLIKSSGHQVNPESLKPTPIPSQTNDTLAAYHNKDLAENFYSINVPQSWQIQPTQNIGEYDFVFNSGTAKVELMDIPDNTTLELIVLSQEEPMLKASLNGYVRVDYQKLTVNGNDAYRLHYLNNLNGVKYENIKTFITGTDHANVITFSAEQPMFGSLKNQFDKVLTSFSWGN